MPTMIIIGESCDDDADAARARASDGGASGDGEDHAYHIEFRFFFSK